MSKDLTVIRDVLCGHAQGLSLKKIQEVTGVPKTSVKRIIDQAHTTELSIEALLHQPDEAIIELMMPSRRARMNYVEPDWESVALQGYLWVTGTPFSLEYPSLRGGFGWHDISWKHHFQV